MNIVFKKGKKTPRMIIKLTYFTFHPPKNLFYLTRNKTQKMNAHVLPFNINYLYGKKS